MKLFSCGDVVPGCDARFSGVAESDVLTQVAVHARSAHGISSIDAELAELAEMVRSHIVVG